REENGNCPDGCTRKWFHESLLCKLVTHTSTQAPVAHGFNSNDLKSGPLNSSNAVESAFHHFERAMKKTFGNFEFDDQLRILSREGHRVKLTGQGLDLVSLLL